VLKNNALKMGRQIRAALCCSKRIHPPVDAPAGQENSKIVYQSHPSHVVLDMHGDKNLCVQPTDEITGLHFRILDYYWK
jgi:hypothetical protein